MCKTLPCLATSRLARPSRASPSPGQPNHAGPCLSMPRPASPWRELNPRAFLRSEPLYPLSYKGVFVRSRDGVRTRDLFLERETSYRCSTRPGMELSRIVVRALVCQDSNLECFVQSETCCQLHHRPSVFSCMEPLPSLAPSRLARPRLAMPHQAMPSQTLPSVDREGLEPSTSAMPWRRSSS